MHVITLPNGLRVDLGAATVSLSSRWTSDDRAKEGLAADIVCASIDAPVIAGNGFATVETICDTAGGATRRARVVAELIEKAVTRRAELLATMPAEDLTPPAPVAAPVPAAPTSPAFVYAGERGSDLEGLLDGYDHGTAFYTSPQPAPTAQSADSVQEDAAFEAVRKELCALPRYSFVLDDDGSVCVPDRTGNWIEFDEAHALFDPGSVDAALAAQGGK